MEPAAPGSTMGYVLKSTLIYYEGQGTGGETGNFKITCVLRSGCSVPHVMFLEYKHSRQSYIDGHRCSF